MDRILGSFNPVNLVNPVHFQRRSTTPRVINVQAYKEVAMPATSKPELLGFLEVIGNMESQLRGGVLFIEKETRMPYEFRCTAPVLPTRTQQTLYGDTLKPYVYVQLVALPLLKAAQIDPAVLLTTNKTLLQVRPSVNYPVVFLRATQPSSTIGTMEPHADFPDDRTEAQKLLKPLDEQDILEPFDRLKKAIEESRCQNGDVELWRKS
jgi:hypothetical protein